MPRPRVNLTRYHGVFVPNIPQRGKITPDKRGKRTGVRSTDEVKAEVEYQVAMT